VGLLTKVLGFRVSDYMNTMVFLRGNPRHHSVAFQPRMPDLPRSRDKRMWHFMVEANSIDDVGSALDLASKAGVPVVSTLGRHSNDQMVSFYMSTPSGFEVEYGWAGVSWTTRRGRCSVTIAGRCGVTTSSSRSLRSRSLVSATCSGRFLRARRAGPVVGGGDALPRPR
jgi:hypothetical protein